MKTRTKDHIKNLLNYRRRRRTPDYIKRWIFNNTAFERLIPEE